MSYDQPWPKFAPDGRVLAHPGCTILCHLDQQGPNAGFFRALLDLYRIAPELSFLDNVAMLPPSSYHATIFGLVTERSRKPERWPAWIAPDASMDECARLIGARLAGLRFDIETPLRMRVAPREPLERVGTLAIGLSPFDEADNVRLRRLRDRLADAFGVRAPSHDAYGFHVTLGYLLREPGETIGAVRETLKDWHARVAAAGAEIKLGAPEFCTFKDMFAFERQFFLA
jgi:hypothetical protein